MTKTAYVYILASQKCGTLYTGVTCDLMQRVHQHRTHLLEGFTHWFLQGEDITAAIALEKKIKNRGRQWKIDLIEKGNPDWKDLAADWMSAGARDEDRPACKIAALPIARRPHA